jgi:Mrp family chromosome partitioning ATPase
MSTTNEAFIKAYRSDAARTATPGPAHLRQSASAHWRTSVEIVSPDHAPRGAAIDLTSAAEPISREPSVGGLSEADGLANFRAISTSATTPTPAIHSERSPGTRSIGKRPLSAFLADRAAPPRHAAEAFTPETTVSAFRWPRVCHELWEQYHDQYDRVAEMLLTKCHDQGSLIGVGGLRAGDGCTTTLLCLAMSLAARNARPILVDANFAAPRLAHRLGVEPTATWQDVLAHGVPVAEAVIRAANDNVDLLPLDSHTDHAPQLVAGLQSAVTAGVLRHAYRIVLVDLGPILDPEAFAATGQLVRSMRIDAAVLVTDAHRADAGDLASAGELLSENGCELLGAIENRVAKPQAADHGL